MACGVTATWVGNSRLPRLRRLARKTCGPGIFRPLYQKKATSAASTTTRPAIPHTTAAGRPAPESGITLQARKLRTDRLTSLLKRPAVKVFQAGPRSGSDATLKRRSSKSEAFFQLQTSDFRLSVGGFRRAPS